ncbi:MAG: FeoB-associated Cys-rich membrane protein [Deltaproteobacteria bacterium]|jgi:hypothetical protein|nr:FeoB-associated Cys-rich membrane protein [Deltaproteobacteria bacterium]
MEYLIVSLIIAAAVGLAFYKVFYRPSCNCGSSSCGKNRGPGVEDPLAEEPKIKQ